MPESRRTVIYTAHFENVHKPSFLCSKVFGTAMRFGLEAYFEFVILTHGRCSPRNDGGTGVR